MLRDCDKLMLERLEESNPLGWAPFGRDKEGNAILKADLPGAKDPKTGERVTRHCFMKVTPEGLLYDTVIQ